MAQFKCPFDGEEFDQWSRYQRHLASSHPPHAPTAADVEKAIAGIHFPKTRDELVAYAAQRLPAASPVRDLVRALPARTYRDAAEVAIALGELMGGEKRAGERDSAERPSRKGGMAAATGAVSAAAVAKMLAGIEFPANARRLREHARKNRDRVQVADEVIQVIDQLPEREYSNMADVEREVGRIL